MGNATFRRLIEVDLPIRRISNEARREKSIRQGNISSLHVWWARRPLAACRAVVLAALLPDPADVHCSQTFRDGALRALQLLPGKMRPQNDREGLRRALLDFIGDFSEWDRSADPIYIKAARDLVVAAYPDGPPSLLDPFSGGGSIPLEALRVGAEAWASDLNPVAILVQKVTLEYIPRYRDRLADGVRRWGARIGEQAATELGRFYPPDTGGNIPIAYLWARTALCEGPGCGSRIPLLRGMWLSKKAGGNVALKLHVVAREVSFSIMRGPKASDVGPGTIRRGSLTCPVCGHTTAVAAIRSQFRTRRGGTHDARLLAVRFDDPNTGERSWRLAEGADLEHEQAAVEELRQRQSAHRGRLSLVPDEPLPPQGTLGFRIQGYGMASWGDLFTPRQALALSCLVGLVSRNRESIASEVGDPGLADAISTCLALAVDRMADFNASLCVLNSVGGRGLKSVFARQALPMVWDFMETNPFNTEAANWATCIEVVDRVINQLPAVTPATVQRVSATSLPLPDESIDALITDPPYYDAVPYADLSDYFYVWLRRSLLDVHPDLLSEDLSPKAAEIIVNSAAALGTHRKLKPFFEAMMAEAFKEARRALKDDGVAVVVFAHKSTEGWEAMLQALVSAGWTVTGSWPIDTERPGRLRAQKSAALASSVHLVCRPRPVHAGVGDWSAILRELQPRVDAWMGRLSSEGVVGADAIFACLGPAIELYSRFDRVETAAGEQVPLGGRSSTGDDFLSHVWAAVARAALRTIFEEAEASGFEADGRLAAVWLWTLGAGKLAANGNDTVPLHRTEDSDTDADDDDEEELDDDNAPMPKLAGFILPYDTARKLAQPLGADLAELGNRPGAAFEVKGAIARMLPLSERRMHLFDSDGVVPSNPRHRTAQVSLFAEDVVAVSFGGVKPGATTLDRLHQAMLLFAEDRGGDLRRLLVEDGAGEDERFWRLADALSKLYPATSSEKRWVDGVLARKRMLNL